MEQKQGIVYLIGAGPGDYKLITLRGKECIEQADTIVYDYLADKKILQWAKEGATIIYAGKQANKHTMKQEEINELLVKEGQAGKVVARLKGGDPLVFGRGGEEALALVEAGVPFAFVPGVTSPIGAAAYGGIPVTHRNVATSFAVVTGHEDPTKEESGMNWEGLATAVDTLCFVMAVGNLGLITEQLMKHGRPGDTPAALIRWGTKANQEVLVSTVASISQDVEAAGLKPPALLVIGDVVALRDQLRWFDIKPLFGKTVVVTRARSQSSAVVAQLEDLGAQVIESPAIETVPLVLSEEEKELMSQIQTFDVLVFTSAQGVRYFFKELHALGYDSRILGRITLCTIGKGTSAALREEGLFADIIPQDYRGESLVAALQEHLFGGERVMLIQPKVARTTIPDGLDQMNVEYSILRLYETRQTTEGAHELEAALEEGSADYITFTSSSTVTNTLTLLGDGAQEKIQKAKIVCIGPITAATCVEEGLTPDIISKEYTVDGIVEALVADATQKGTDHE